jgi:O-antigen/teichoic acid export membrane protein
VGIAVRGLGPEGFALFVVVTSFVSWVGLAGIGVGPGLTLSVARATSEHDELEGTRQFAVALVLMLTVASVLVIGAWFLGAVGVVDALLRGLIGSAPEDGRTALQVMAVLVALQLIVVVPESAQLGLHTQHVSNVWAAIGSAAAIIAMLAGRDAVTSVTAFVLISQGPQVVARCLNGILFVFRHRMIVHVRGVRFWQHASRLIRSGTAFAGLSLATFISLQAGLIIVAASTDPASVALAGVIVRGYTLGMSGLSLISTPTWPAIARASARGDRRWIARAYRWLTGAALLYSGVAAIAILIAFEPLIEIWTGLRVADNLALRVLLAIFVLVNGWAHANAMTLVGLGSIGFTAVVLIAESVLVLGLLAASIPLAGVAAYVGALAVGAIFVSGWILPLRVFRQLNRASE